MGLFVFLSIGFHHKNYGLEKLPKLQPKNNNNNDKNFRILKSEVQLTENFLIVMDKFGFHRQIRKPPIAPQAIVELTNVILMHSMNFNCIL